MLLSYVTGGKGLLQPHDLLDHVEKILQEDEGMQKLKEGPFVQELESAQVITQYILSIALVIFFSFLCFFRFYKATVSIVIGSHNSTTFCVYSFASKTWCLGVFSD